MAETRKDGKADKVRFFVPSVAEYNHERTMAVQCRQVIVGPATLEDLANVDLFDYIQKTKRFTIKYQQHDDGEYKGFLELTFGTSEEAATCAEALSKLEIREDIKVVHAYPVNNKPVNTCEIRQHGDPEAKHRAGFAGSGFEYHDAERTLVVIDIADDLTEEDLMNAFPTASSCFIPVSYANKSHKKKGHAYVDFKNDKDLARYLGKAQNIKNKPYKTTKPELLPTCPALLKKIEHFRRTQLPMSSHMIEEPMPVETVAVLKAFLNHTHHYSDVDYIKPEEKTKLEEARKNLSRFLYADNDLRRDLGMELIPNSIVKKTYKQIATADIPKSSGPPSDRRAGKRGAGNFDNFEAKRARMGAEAGLRARAAAEHRIAEDRRRAAAAAYGRDTMGGGMGMGGGMRGGMGDGMMESVTRMATKHVMEAINSRMGGGMSSGFMDDGFEFGGGYGARGPMPRAAGAGLRGGARGRGGRPGFF